MTGLDYEIGFLEVFADNRESKAQSFFYILDLDTMRIKEYSINIKKLSRTIQ